MFGRKKKKPAPAQCTANPGVGIKAAVGFANDEKSWSEVVDLVKVAETALQKNGYAVTNEKTWLRHTESGFEISPQFVSFHMLEDGGIQTMTTVQTNHPNIVPGGLFEYQHSAANTLEEAIFNGFHQWVNTDFVTLLDCAREKPADCMVLEMSFPAKGDQPARDRRIILGPIAHLVQDPPATRVEDPNAEEHSFCPCCLLTKSFPAFKELVEGNGFYGVRIFASRESDRGTEADCRVNGEDWETGAIALKEYADTWEPAGYEFRKQYVIIQTVEKSVT